MIGAIWQHYFAQIVAENEQGLKLLTSLYLDISVMTQVVRHNDARFNFQEGENQLLSGIGFALMGLSLKNGKNNKMYEWIYINLFWV
jgi:hypothetical protein